MPPRRNTSPTDGSTKGRFLAKLEDGEEFEQWIFKFRAWCMRNGFDKIVDEEEEDEEKNKKLWSEIVEACDGEAASVVRDAEEGDGLEAYEKLKERFQSATATKTAALFQGVLEYMGTWEHGNGGGGSREMVGTRGAGRKHEGLPNGMSGETGTCLVLSHCAPCLCVSASHQIHPGVC
jgi:hypothetical protein